MISFKNVSKSFENKKILDNINIDIEENTITCLIGESGCGKTTLLKMINRLYEPTKGTITINKALITFFKSYVIILKLSKVPKEKIEKRTIELMEMIGLNSDFLNRYPSELSGGQQQRVGIARAFAINPDIILMDEPFSALDPVTRTSLQDELLRIQSKYKKTIVFVTHDMDEAIKLADKIAIIDEGHLVQYDTPERVLKHPTNDFVKNFVGIKKIWSSPELIKVEDIMIEHPVTCNKNYSLFYCINKMRMMKVDTLMVVDENNLLIGILYADNLLNLSMQDKKAEDYMEREFLVTHPNDSIVDLVNLINEHKITTMPVTDKKGHLKGLITRSTLLTYMSKQFTKEEEGK